ALTSINGVLVSIKEAFISIEKAFELIKEASVSIEEALVLIEELSKTPQRTELISTIWQLPEEELSLANNLISTMRYLKGPNKEMIISSYL
ncbi:25521_t:CDS:1, partial [Gigaspora margarita]